MDIRKVRRDAEAFVRAVDREFYENHAGLKEELNTSAIFDRYQHLFTPDAVAWIRGYRKGAEGEELRRARQLQALLIGEHLGNAAKQLTDREQTWESQKVLAVDGEAIPFRMASVRMANEADRARRGALFRAQNEALGEVNPLLAERMELLHRLARSLGYDHYQALYGDIKGLDFNFLKGAMDRLVQRTQHQYEEAMGYYLRPLGIPLGEAEKHDIAHLLRGSEFDGHFPKGEAVETLARTLKGLGFTLKAGGNIEVDAKERPRKSPRAFCAPLRVPSEVKLVIMPQGGYSDYDALLHEAGHAQHYAHVAKNAAMEHKYLGDNSVTEAYAFLLQYLLTSPGWLAEYAALADPSAFLAFVWTRKLYFLRRYAAKLNYELELHTKGVEDMGPRYREVMEGALGFHHPEAHYLTDVDDGFYVAQYLRAWIFEAQLRQALEEQFDERWFLEPRAGALLRGLWRTGQKFQVGELAEELGYAGLDPDPLIESLEEAPTPG